MLRAMEPPARELFDRWYRLDGNEELAAYRLLPRSTPDGERSEGIWSADEPQLFVALAESAVELPVDAQHAYFGSATEREALLGVFAAPRGARSTVTCARGRKRAASRSSRATW